MTNTTPNNDLQFDAKDIADNKTMAMLSYIGILVLIPLLTKKDSKFAQAHAKQGLVMAVAMMLYIIPVAGWIIGTIALVLDVIALVSALQGKFWKIPGAYDLSQKLKI
ncbi:MAG: hypothetical protein WCW27_04460 [Patescibacteria group bacterium]|jgi:uncharacterized membrane protein